MAAFGGFTLTNRGRALQAKAQAGATLNYTKAMIGDGSITSQSIVTLTNLISPKMTLPITGVRPAPPDRAYVESRFNNQNIQTGFYFREIGIYAQDPDVGEVLYAYANSGNNAEYIPPTGGSDIVEKSIRMNVFVGTATNITATIDSSLVFPTRQEVEEMIAAIEVEVVDSYESTDKTVAPSADALRRGLSLKQDILRLADNFLPSSSLVNAAPDPNSGRAYPDGVSMFKVSSSAGGWPAANGYVLTFRAGSGGYQIFYEMYTGAVQTDKTARQWTRSKRDSNTFWQAWAQTMTEVDIATRLPLTGGDMTGAIKRTYGTNYKTYRNVAGLQLLSTATSTGAVKIKLPRTFSGTMLDIEISGYSHAANNGAWSLVLSAFSNSGSGGNWIFANANLRGNVPFSSVTLGFDGTDSCIILGGVTTIWPQTALSVERVTAAFSNSDGWESGWDISLITDISGITKAVQPTLQKLATQAYADAAVATHAADYVRNPGYTPATRNASDVYTGSLSPAPANPAVLPDGFAVTIVPDAANTTTTPKLQLNSGATIEIRRNPTTPYAVGAIKAGQPLSLIKVGDYFLARSAGATGNATPAQVRSGVTFSNENNVDQVGTLPVRATTQVEVTSNQTLDGGIYDNGIRVNIPFSQRYYASNQHYSGGSVTFPFTPKLIKLTSMTTGSNTAYAVISKSADGVIRKAQTTTLNTTFSSTSNGQNITLGPFGYIYDGGAGIQYLVEAWGD